MGRERRITDGVGTIPESHVLTGIVSTSPYNDRVLLYTGSNDIAAIISPASVSFTNSTFWAYVVGVSPYVVRITGIYKVGDNSYSLTIDRDMTGAAGAVFHYVRAGVTYSYTVDGEVDATINGVTVKVGESNNYQPFEIYSNRPLLQPVSYVDATGTDVFISEEL